MCIIAIKSAGVPIDWDILDNCELSNPDGAGYAYVRDGEVVISKGYFTNEEMRAVIEPELGNGTGVEIMFHFRIATHGKVAPSTCHPFPLTNDRQEICKLQTTQNVTSQGTFVCQYCNVHIFIEQDVPEKIGNNSGGLADLSGCTENGKTIVMNRLDHCFLKIPKLEWNYTEIDMHNLNMIFNKILWIRRTLQVFLKLLFCKIVGSPGRF